MKTTLSREHRKILETTIAQVHATLEAGAAKTLQSQGRALSDLLMHPVDYPSAWPSARKIPRPSIPSPVANGNHEQRTTNSGCDNSSENVWCNNLTML